MMIFLCKMKKMIGVCLVVFLFSGCASSPPKPPEPKGDFTPVNPKKVNALDLKI